jgi:hypothetical protein
VIWTTSLQPIPGYYVPPDAFVGAVTVGRQFGRSVRPAEGDPEEGFACVRPGHPDKKGVTTEIDTQETKAPSLLLSNMAPLRPWGAVS